LFTLRLLATIRVCHKVVPFETPKNLTRLASLYCVTGIKSHARRLKTFRTLLEFLDASVSFAKRRNELYGGAGAYSCTASGRPDAMLNPLGGTKRTGASRSRANPLFHRCPIPHSSLFACRTNVRRSPGQSKIALRVNYFRFAREGSASREFRLTRIAKAASFLFRCPTSSEFYYRFIGARESEIARAWLRSLDLCVSRMANQATSRYLERYLDVSHSLHRN